ncbi:hypothetical protein, partial [Enterobacter hormaechei]|uniref:hypothetical protein n=1 Tax=Enterobacter hormaechei TaxID=158836 RepID=UPI00203F7D84
LASQPELKRVRSRWIKQQLVLFQHAVVAGCVEGQIIKSTNSGCNPIVFGCFWLFHQNDKYAA